MIAVAVALAAILGDRLWLGPQLATWSAAASSQALATTRLLTLRTEMAQRVVTARTDDAQWRADATRLRAQIARGNASLGASGNALVGPDDMVAVLDGLMGQAHGLRLRSMKSLGRETVDSSAQSAASAASGTLYRHGIELSVQGSYASVVDYLRAVEAMPEHVLWGGLQMKVEQYPDIIVTVRLYTLSRDRDWLHL